MEDCCAVCAEPLQWIAYGPCGHREVCSTCTARMRVVLGDKKCCICKRESSHVFVTRDLGQYTTLIKDFGSLLHKASESLLFDRSMQAYFDSQEEFNRIKTLCKIQCSVCEAGACPTQKGFVKPGFVFKSLSLLHQHLSSAHKLSMCQLCLEGRKVFVSEQVLYTASQLESHCSKGDARIGFKGHPECEFCRRRFYGDNELFHHMSTEHFTCHFCQSDKPDQYDYFQAYEDLEAHFSKEHILCGDPECLAKKFVVFRSESEFKIHNAQEHGNRLTRAQRTAALKVPVSLRVRRYDRVLSPLRSVELANTPPPAADDPSNFPALPGNSRRRKQRNRAKKPNAASSSAESVVQQGAGENAGSSGRSCQASCSSSNGAHGPSVAGISLTVDQIRDATQLLLQQIRVELRDNESKISEFKAAHSRFRNGTSTCAEYYDQIIRLGLSSIVPELARLCPDPQKQQELHSVHLARAAGCSGSRPKGKDPAAAGPSSSERWPSNETSTPASSSWSCGSSVACSISDKPKRGGPGSVPAGGCNGASTVARGAWKNGGGMRLVSQARRESIMYAAHCKPRQ